jgi:hypothetical protein
MSDEEMSSVVSTLMVSGLEGCVGSNPMLLKIYPPTQDYTEEAIIAKALPHGAQPYQFYMDTMDSRKLLIYTFEIRQEGRNDLGSIGLVVGKDTIMKNLQTLIKELVNDMQTNGVLTFDILQEYLPQIIDGLNNQCKIKFGKVKFDVASMLKKQNIALQLDSRKVRGMF